MLSDLMFQSGSSGSGGNGHHGGGGSGGDFEGDFTTNYKATWMPRSVGSQPGSIWKPEVFAVRISAY